MNKAIVIRYQPLAAMLSAAILAMVFAPPASAFRPDSPEVQKMVTSGVKFLESKGAKQGRPGATALIGLVKYKQTHDEKDPLVLDAVKHIRSTLSGLDPRHLGKDNIYDIGLMLIFLTELDSAKKTREYAPEVKCMLENLALRQKKCGAWGYDNRGTGDTSMTQYGVLGYWTAMQNGYDIPVERIDAVADWLLRTQDPSGAFGYQGTVSSSYTPVKQTNVRHSMAAAGLGSVYICADMLGMKSKVEASKRQDLAPALKRVVKKEPEKKDGNKKKLNSRLSPRLFHPVQTRGNRWFGPSPRIDPPQWTYYYLYALERYESFRELAEGRVKSERVIEPSWYNDGIVFLQKTQKENGCWEGRAEKIPCTCFALLFMLRSSAQSIDQLDDFGEGICTGARGIPNDTDRVVVRDGKVMTKPLLGPAQELIGILEDGDRDIDDYEQMMVALPELPPTEVQAIAVKHKDLLYQLAGHQLGEARLAALETMEKTRDFDYVPILIYVLMTDGQKDGHTRVACKARDILRRFARKPKGFGMPDQPDEADRRAAAAAWKEWYLAVRPDAKFKK